MFHGFYQHPGKPPVRPVRARTVDLERQQLSRAAGLPYVRPLRLEDQGIEEGKIDLLFEEDGAWVLVDYKTDAVAEEEAGRSAHFAERYSAQLSAYDAALGDMGVGVRSAYILLARTGEAIEVEPGLPRD
jgi:ATP-dependent exoDNAse (exonuclease V) beta subunit